MTDAMEKQFLADIIEHPDEDVPRLIYADWLDDHADGLGNKEKQKPFNDKAEFIRAQVALASGKEHGGVLTDDRRKELECREQKLLETYQATWEQPLRDRGVTCVEYRRGLPDGITISASDFFSYADQLFDLAPIREAWLFDVTAEQMTPLANSPHLEKLTSLNLGLNSIGNNGARSLANSPHVKNLKQLDLSNNEIGNDGARSLANSPHVKNLKQLDLSNNEIGNDGARAIAESPHLENLTSLRMGCNEIGITGIRALANSQHMEKLTNLDLSINEIGDGGVQALASSPHMQNLTDLSLMNNNIGPTGAQALADSTHLKNLKRLDLSRNRIGNNGAWVLANSPSLASLAELYLIDAAIDDNTLREINRTMDRRRAEARQR